MEKDDAQLIHDILSGNDIGIQHISSKIPKEYSRLCVAKDRRFPPCSRDNPRHFSTRISGTLNAQESKPLCLDGSMLSQIGFALIGCESKNLRCNRWTIHVRWI